MNFYSRHILFAFCEVLSCYFRCLSSGNATDPLNSFLALPLAILERLVYRQ